MRKFPTRRLDAFIADGVVLLGRGDVISKNDIDANPGPYPIYSSSAHNNGKFGEYGKFMFNEELISWSVDGGGYFFYREKHQYSVTNVCGYMRLQSEKLHPKFVFYALVNQHRFLTFDYTSKAHPSVIKKQYWLPSIGVTYQRKIAAILTSIDTAIEKTEALIAKYQQIKAGLMHDLFTRGVLPNGTLRPPREQAPELYQETAVGWIPREWNLSDCGQMFAIDSGITLGPHRRPAKRPHAYLRVANIHRDEIRLHDVAKLEALPGETEYSLKKYDLLVVEGHANRSEIGRCAMVFDDAEGMLFQNHLFRLRSSILDAQYALLWMNSHHAQRYWESACATSSGLNTINKKMLRSMAVCVPSNNEQKQIAETASTIRQMLRTEADKLRKLQHQKLGLMQDLLTGKVPVEPAPEPLDTTDA